MIDLHAVFRNTQSSSEKIMIALISVLLIFWNLGIETHYKRLRAVASPFLSAERLKNEGVSLQEQIDHVETTRSDMGFIALRLEELRDIYLTSAISFDHAIDSAHFVCNRLFLRTELIQVRD